MLSNFYPNLINVLLYQRMVAKKVQKSQLQKQRTRRHVKTLTIVLETNE